MLFSPKCSDVRSWSTRRPADGREVGDGDDLALGVALDDDDLPVAEAAQAERVVRGGEELDAREHLAEARHDPHPPARMEVRAELVDQHGALGGVHARPLP